MRKVCIYADEGTSKVGVDSLQQAVESKLNCAAVCIHAEDIFRGVLEGAVALIIPGGADLPYCAKLNGQGNRLIRHFVAGGGVYIGICAGAYYACREVDFTGDGYQICGERELALFNGTAKGSLPALTRGRYYNETIETKSRVELDFGGRRLPFYYHGGPTFISTEKDFTVLAHYPTACPAVISGTFGLGRYLLSGVHFELQWQSYQKYVVECCQDPQIRRREQQWQTLFSHHYGDPLWEQIKRLIG